MQNVEQQWRRLSEEVISGMKEWRDHHPKATLGEIEEAIDERLGRLRARMVQDAALASAQADWSQAEPEQRPKCSQCRTALVARGKKERHIQTQGGQEVIFKRSYGVCPSCGGGLFPPG